MKARASRWGPWAWAWAWVASLLIGCGQDPETMLSQTWVETGWSFAKVDELPAEVRRFDGIRIRAFEEHVFFRHESEYWHFYPDHSFEIALKTGQIHTGRWRLKGRGHVLTLRYAGGGVEAFDVKELSADRLVLHVHLGMEMRGIARLTFSRQKNADSRAHFAPRDSGSALRREI